MDNARDLVAFASKWRHWGGGPAEDIFIEFGLTVPEYCRRLRTALNSRFCTFGISDAVLAEVRYLNEIRLQDHGMVGHSLPYQP